MRRRWAKHKHDWIHGNRTCTLAGHGQELPHPIDPELKYLKNLPLDSTKKKIQLIEREVWWQENVGIHRFGLNIGKDLATVSRNKRRIK